MHNNFRPYYSCWVGLVLCFFAAPLLTQELKFQDAEQVLSGNPVTVEDSIFAGVRPTAFRFVVGEAKFLLRDSGQLVQKQSGESIQLWPSCNTESTYIEDCQYFPTDSVFYLLYAAHYPDAIGTRLSCIVLSPFQVRWDYGIGVVMRDSVAFYLSTDRFLGRFVVSTGQMDWKYLYPMQPATMPIIESMNLVGDTLAVSGRLMNQKARRHSREFKWLFHAGDGQKFD